MKGLTFISVQSQKRRSSVLQKIYFKKYRLKTPQIWSRGSANPKVKPKSTLRHIMIKLLKTEDKKSLQLPDKNATLLRKTN